MKIKTLQPGAELMITIRECADGYLLGTINLFGIPMHANFIRVKEEFGEHEEEGEQVCDSMAPQATENWDSFCQLQDAAFQTIKIPGFPGEWVCVIHPHGK